MSYLKCELRDKGIFIQGEDEILRTPISLTLSYKESVAPWEVCDLWAKDYGATLPTDWQWKFIQRHLDAINAVLMTREHKPLTTELGLYWTSEIEPSADKEYAMVAVMERNGGFVYNEKDEMRRARIVWVGDVMAD